MTNISYDSLIFSEFRTVAIAAAKNEVDEASLVKAMTVNEELKALGYTLSPADVITLSKSNSLNTFYAQVKGLIGDVKAAPMYPNFPNEVLALDEAQFRFHQMLHYLSTYGLEQFTGAPVVKGWLPHPDTEEKSEEDTVLLKSKVIELIPEDEKYSRFFKKILSKAERMTDKEKMIVKEAAANIPVEQMCSVSVRFKQNLFDVFYTIFISDLDADRKKKMLHSICQHTGDVWKCLDYTLTRQKFSLKTSQKRLFVKLLESYPVSDLENNILLSDKKGKRVGLLLNYISFNIYSRSPEHRKIIDSFRDGELRSWESRATELISAHSPETIPFIAKRPGMLLRKLAYLVRCGFPCKDLADAMLSSADKLSVQTLITTLTYFGKKAPDQTPEKADEAQKVYDICLKALEKSLEGFNTDFKGKKVYLDLSGYVPELSSVQCNDKSGEGGYIRSGLAIKLPDNVDRIRFFVYWNDKRRVDVDLHGAIHDVKNEAINIGWCSAYKHDDIAAFSGDITHSDAAEYIDVVTDPKRVKDVSLNINLYSGADNFGDIDECYVGIMAVNKLGEEVKLYNPANCFFSHYLTSKVRNMNYGYIDIEHMAIVFDGKAASDYYSPAAIVESKFNLSTYLELLLKQQGAVVVDTPEDADKVLVMEKASKDNEISILDNNFFIPAE